MGTGTTPPTSSSPAHQRKQIVMGARTKIGARTLAKGSGSYQHGTCSYFDSGHSTCSDLFYPAASACSYCVLKVITQLMGVQPYRGTHTVIPYAAICE